MIQNYPINRAFYIEASFLWSLTVIIAIPVVKLAKHLPFQTRHLIATGLYAGNKCSSFLITAFSPMLDYIFAFFLIKIMALFSSPLKDFSLHYSSLLPRSS